MKIFEEIIELEKMLLNPSIRRTPSELDKLLSDDFIEFGSSGKIYDKKIVIERLLVENPIDIDATDFVATQLSMDVIQLRFKTQSRRKGGTVSSSLRSSIWKKVDSSWQMIFHQGTRM